MALLDFHFETEDSFNAPANSRKINNNKLYNFRAIKAAEILKYQDYRVHINDSTKMVLW